MVQQRRALALLAVWPTLALSRGCSKIDEPCRLTGCCKTPKSQCFQKNDTAAYCKFAQPPGWTGIILTYGCNKAWGQCEGGKDQKDDIIPCCQWGCLCNYTSPYFHQCIPPDGLNQCTKDGPQIFPDFSEEGDKKGDKDDKDGKSSKSGDDKDKKEHSIGSDADCVNVGGLWLPEGCHDAEEKAEVITDASVRPLQAAGRVPGASAFLKLGGAASAAVAAAAAGMFLWRRRRSQGYSHQNPLELGDEESS